jgi:olefin beta-lactone synthetase
MNVVDLFMRQVWERAGQPAIIDTGGKGYRIHAYSELASDSAHVAGLLDDNGIGPGDPVLILQPMSYELYVVLLAVFRVGAVAMFVDPSTGRRHVSRCCAIGEPRALIAGPKAHLLRLVTPGMRRIPKRFLISGWFPGTIGLTRARNARPLESIARGGDAPALLTFTSGSTGEPKAAVRSHDFLIAQHAAIAANLDLQAKQRDLTTLPIFLLANLASGLTSVIPHGDLRSPGRIDAAPLVSQIHGLQIGRCAASPAFIERLVSHCEQHGTRLPLTRVELGGAPVFPTLLSRLQAVAPQADVVAVYGSTEAEPMAGLHLADLHESDLEAMGKGAGLLAGEPVAQIRLKVIRDRFGMPIGPFDEDRFEQEALGPGQVGEIVVSGEHVLPGYLNGQGDAETKFRVSDTRWHRTGDAGYLDREGRLWLLGRCSARIDDGRGVTYPFRVECAAQFVDGVRRSALLSHRGLRVLLVEGSSDLDTEALRRRLSWAHIDQVRRVTAIPVDRRHNAKVDYTRLARLVR